MRTWRKPSRLIVCLFPVLPVMRPHAYLIARRLLARVVIRTKDQPRRPRSRAYAGGEDTPALQHAGSRRGSRRDQIMPRDNPWNEDISKRPLLPNSDAMIARITADLASNRRTLRLFTEMNYVLVPDNQPLVPVRFENYPDESDLNGGKSPVGFIRFPPICRSRSWPVGAGSLTLAQWQQDTANSGGDRHSIIVQPGAGVFYETWETKKTGNGWQASNGAKFSLTSNALRPNGWTSGDATGRSADVSGTRPL